MSNSLMKLVDALTAGGIELIGEGAASSAAAVAEYGSNERHGDAQSRE